MFYLIAGLLVLFIVSGHYVRLGRGARWRFIFHGGLWVSVGIQSVIWLTIMMRGLAGEIGLWSVVGYGVYGGVLLVGALVMVMSEGARLWLGRGMGRAYQHDDAVHRVALAVMWLVCAYVPSVYLAVGGLEGVADIIAGGDVRGRLLSQVLDMVFLMVIAFLGVGLFMGRGWQATMSRLGLRVPTERDWRWGLGAGVALFLALIPAGMVLTVFFSAEALEAQQVASNEVFRAYSGSLALGLMLALTAGIGEEVLFRGALQPVFGVWVTTCFFVLVHLQYTLTPASIIIFGVTLAFAYLRERISTTAAIIAHIIYNALPFLLFAWVSGSV